MREKEKEKEKEKPSTSSSVWALAGHDPFGGAGLSADMRVAAALQTPLRTLITSLTAQNDDAVLAAKAIDRAWLDQQWKALSQAEKPAAYKIGLLVDVGTVKWLAENLDPSVPLILDPVFAASSGPSFIDTDLLTSLRELLFPRVSLLTPNRPEAEAIVGFKISSEADLHRAAQTIRSQGIAAVLIKGGHGEGSTLIDYFEDGEKSLTLKAERIPGRYRGTGCTYSTAIACYRAQGLELRDAVSLAHAYVQSAILLASEHRSSHLPSVFLEKFVPMDRSIGFYPVLPHSDWIRRLATSGVQTVQLRDKNNQGDALKNSILAAKDLCEKNDIRLFVNDHWQLAIECQVYGVHLGQEDLDALSSADLKKLRASGLRLGISTHSVTEAARAAAFKPSYIALGPVFETTCKSMRFGPQGVARVGEWTRSLPHIPIVAIGGLKLDHAEAIRAEGADGLAVISAITESSDPERAMNAWLKAWQS